MITEFISKNENETLGFAKSFAKTLTAGDIVLLDGDLGAGKTVFAKGLVSALSSDKITAVSPTFVIVNVYDTFPKIFHFDLYRISDISELDAIGAEEYFYSDGISLVEWPERAMEMFPKSAIKICIKKIDDKTRKIVVER